MLINKHLTRLCNVIFYGVTEQNIQSVKVIQYSAARVVCIALFRSSATYLLKSLHWLPVKQRIRFKEALITQKIRLTHEPCYLAIYVNDYTPARTLRSTDTNLLTLQR